VPSPMMTVAVLVVLWLIVVVPMVLRRSDERRRERSVDGFGQAMRALGRRPSATAPPPSASNDPEVYVPIQHRTRIPAPARRPVPAAQEALMYPPDRTELSEARVQMLARRRRSLGILAGGSIVFGLLALAVGGALWLLAAPFLIGLAGYLWFLRSQALRDRSRRESRQLRATSRQHTGWEATTDDVAEFERRADSVVRIDDDDVELMSMDTMDLTGVYDAEAEPAAVQRRAS
jgi:membrane protein implicated in regulation of membrane protease activity